MNKQQEQFPAQPGGISPELNAEAARLSALASHRRLQARSQTSVALALVVTTPTAAQRELLRAEAMYRLASLCAGAVVHALPPSAVQAREQAKQAQQSAQDELATVKTSHVAWVKYAVACEAASIPRLPTSSRGPAQPCAAGRL